MRALEEDGAPTIAAEIDSAHVYAYLARSMYLAAESRHRYFREVRCFFNCLVDAGYIDRTPFRGMKNVRLPQKIVQPFSVQDINALLDACEGPMVLRDRALILLLLDTGARCSEVVQLNLEDLDLSGHRLQILHAKGNKQRIVSFAANCEAALRAYLELRGDGPGPLFFASTGHRDLIPGRALHANGLKQILIRLSAGALDSLRSVSCSRSIDRSAPSFQ